MASFVTGFIQPLVERGFALKVDPAIVARDLAVEAPNATAYQMDGAVRRIATTRRYATFPSIAECLDALKSVPISDPAVLRSEAPAAMLPPPSGSLVARANRLLADYRRASPSERRGMERINRRALEVAEMVIDMDDRHRRTQPRLMAEMDAMERSAWVAGVLARWGDGPAVALKTMQAAQ